jgi:plasmid stabilization system protein ParE
VNVVWSLRAVTHLADLRAYIAREKPTAADRVGVALVAAVERLAAMPNLGRPGRVSGTRELVVPDTPYGLPYRLRHGQLGIIAVTDGRSGRSGSERDPGRVTCG